MTKQEILKELDVILTEYLQASVSFGGKTFSKPVLEKYLQEYHKMINIKRQAEALIKDYSEQEKLVLIYNNPDLYNQYCELLKQAQEIYFTDYRKVV